MSEERQKTMATMTNETSAVNRGGDNHSNSIQYILLINLYVFKCRLYRVCYDPDQAEKPKEQWPMDSVRRLTKNFFQRSVRFVECCHVVA